MSSNGHRTEYPVFTMAFVESALVTVLPGTAVQAVQNRSLERVFTPAAKCFLRLSTAGVVVIE